jgi:non-specific serine/threonine protein kinase
LAEALATARALGMQSLLDQASRLETKAEPHAQRARHAVGHSGADLATHSNHATPTAAGRVLNFPERPRRTPVMASTVGPPSRQGVFHREGEFWAVGDGAALVRLKDSKGLRYLAHLLRHPGRDLHVTELVALERGSADADPAGVLQEAGLRIDRGDDAQPMLDEKAKAAYKRRLEDLRDGLEEATRFNDLERAARARAEIELLGRELARGVGMGGRNRSAASLAERARLNVSRTIADAVKRITAHNPTLGRFFATTIKTGAFCSYTPDPRYPIDWQL